MRAEMSSAGAALPETITIAGIGSKAVSRTLEDLVRDHARTVFRVAYSVVRNHADAEDVVQETFLRAMKQGRLDRIGNPKAWLVKVAWRIAVDRAKRAKPEPLDDILDTLRSTDAPLDNAIDQQQRSELLHALLVTLPADLRQVVVLSTVDDMTSADVASAMGIPKGSVRTRMMRARQLLKQKLAAMLEKR
jgi:RNA polymerase sigma-70 factor (ECF subfamily)